MPIDTSSYAFLDCGGRFPSFARLCSAVYSVLRSTIGSSRNGPGLAFRLAYPPADEIRAVRFPHTRVARLVARAYGTFRPLAEVCCSVAIGPEPALRDICSKVGEWEGRGALQGRVLEDKRAVARPVNSVQTRRPSRASIGR